MIVARSLCRTLATVAGLAVASCGSGTPGGSETGLLPFAPGQADRTADQIFADAATAMAAAPAMHEHGKDAEGGATIDIIATKDSARFTVTAAAGQSFTLVVVGTAAWTATGTGDFAPLPQSATKEVMALTLGHLSSCMRNEHGHLTKGVQTTVDGRPVIGISDDGSMPGATSGTYWVALDGTNQLVRIDGSGRSTPGGSAECGGSSSSSSSSRGAGTGTLHIDYLNSVPVITPPAAA